MFKGVRGPLISMHQDVAVRYRLPGRMDHINGDGLDNRKINLRSASPQQNSFNNKLQSRRKGKFKGVHRSPGRSLWTAIIIKNGIRKYIGAFNSEITAAAAYNKVALDLFGEFACINDLTGLTYEEPVIVPYKETTSSKFYGVSKYKNKAGRTWWQATVNKGGRKYIGTYNTELEAARAVEEYLNKNINT